MTLTQGQGDSTEWKERGLGAAFYINLTISKKMEWSTYYHFDLNSGSGHNEEIGCIGSPLAFLQAVKETSHKKVQAHFVDKNKESVKKLIPKIDKNWFCHFGDNASFVSVIPEIIKDKPQFAIGSILCDPNGTQIPFYELSKLLAKYMRLDIIINWSATSFLRTRKSSICKTDNPSISDLPELFNKKYWLIRKPQSKHKFLLLVGRNIKVQPHNNLHFYDMESTQGKQIVYECDNTRAERFYSIQKELPLCKQPMLNIKNISSTHYF